jgi:hypothetical protein
MLHPIWFLVKILGVGYFGKKVHDKWNDNQNRLTVLEAMMAERERAEAAERRVRSLEAERHQSNH